MDVELWTSAQWGVAAASAAVATVASWQLTEVYRRRLKRSVAAIDAHVEEWLRDPVNAEKMQAFEQAELEGLDEEATALRLIEIDRRAGRLAPFGTTRTKEGKS